MPSIQEFLSSDEGLAAAQWIAATGTALATLIAAFAIHMNSRERRRDQASKVNAWTTTTETQEGMHGTLHVINSGYAPVFDIAVRALSDNNKTVAAWCAPNLEPGHSKIAVSPDGIMNPHMGKNTSRVEIFFKDGHGRAWTRKPNGRLIRSCSLRNGSDVFIRWSMIADSNTREYS